MGDGRSTHFLEDAWLKENVRLCDSFPRLFSLESEKDCLVSDRLVEEESEIN